MRFFLIYIPLFLTFSNSYGQVLFRDEYEVADPIKDNKEMSLDQKLEIHGHYLEDALKQRDRNKVFYGYLYLVSDHMRNQDYVAANRYLISADSIAELSKIKKWQGHILHRKAILAIRLKDNNGALEYYELSISVCGEAKDSLCVGEAFEQLSYLYGIRQEFELSDEYHKKAVLVLKKYGSPKHLAATYNNFAIITTQRGNVKGAIELYKNAIDIYRSVGMTKEMSKTMNNLADAYRNDKKYDQALDILKECIQLNKKENLYENLYVNYRNLSAVYDSLKDYKSALKFHILFYELNDSLAGYATQNEISALNLKYEVQKKELILAKNKIELGEANDLIRRKTMYIVSIIIVVLIFLYYFNKKILKSKRQLKNSRAEVKSLERKNLKKEGRISDLEEIIGKFKAKIQSEDANGPEKAGEETVPSILKAEDWVVFKNYFSTTYPGYVNRLRESYPDLTEAEERLFLLIKLNHNTIEIAGILGITKDSVKKTRTRLRKRLNLIDGAKLDQFIFDF